ncbi:Spc98 family-domain-containing protein [Cercophora scortea]|uniref:Spindle pole body component n=1 Tax=Cercophora scortea TaxID=314031 RepID=A0AAE0IFZ0_9PEZI|nr:Spc98 family-domain-containing protein [Cercophora scortea]
MNMADEGDKNSYGNADGNRNGGWVNLFAIPDFGTQLSDRLQQTLVDIGRQNPLFSLDIFDTAPHALRLPENENEEPRAGSGFFQLPALLSELAPLHEAPIRDIDSAIKKAQVSKTQPMPEPIQGLEGEQSEDIWLRADDGLARPAQYRTWDKFDQAHQGQPPTVFITEAGPAAFDSLVASGRSSPQPGSDVVEDAAYCACLLSLALGRSSVLFSWDAEKKSFVKTVAHLRTSGLSLKSIQCIDRLCLECANAIKYLQSFSQRTHASASSPATFALAGVVDRLVLAILSELGIRSGRVRSILQLQAIVQPVHSVLSFFETLVARLAREKTDEAMLSCLFQEVQSAEYRDGLLRELTCEVLRLISKPWTDFVQEWIGLKVEEGTTLTKKGPGKSFVKVADRIWTDDQGFELEEPDFFLDEDKMPSFVPPEIAQAIFETGRNLRFLRERHPEHPLSRRDAITRMRPPKVEWQFDWEGIAKLETRVNEYQKAVSLALRGNSLGRQQETGPPGSRDPNEYKLEFFGKSDDQIEANILASMGHLDQPPENREARSRLTTLLRDRLYLRVNGMVDEDGGFSPHWSLVPLLSFGPIIGAQSRLVNHECMKLLFSAHDLRVHIDLLKQCYLLDNGVLCSRLSHALFDPDLETAERKSGVAFGGGVMGLRLGGRETWPPASSELRLVLMGVLSDSYNSPSQGTQEARPTVTPRSLVSDLPGDLSFAIRDLNSEEIDRCLNPDGVEALDFLQLSYKPPSPLRPIMSPMILYKYDRIFRLLLRVLRMLYVVNQLFRFIPLSKRLHGQARPSNASVRFCIEARHFISQLAAYFFDTGISAPWLTFETWLKRVESELSGDSETTPDAHDPVDMSTKNCSPDMVRDRQEQVLDDIMLALFLRKRQQPVLKLLEEIFTVILRFAKQVRVRGPGGVEAKGKQNQAETAEKLYAAFREKVEVFLSVCKGLGEKTGAGGKSSSKADGGGIGGVRRPSESPFETLVLMLDMAGFYGKKAGKGAGMF